MIRVGIVGATGYTGVELLRLLISHPSCEIVVATSDSEKGKDVSEVFPSLRSHIKLRFEEHKSKNLMSCDVVFFATPHATAMHQVPRLLDSGCKIIDLSADFRIKDPVIWEEWYKEKHICPELLESAVYGLPELNRDKIKKTNLLANPGCYPTAIALALLPAIKGNFIRTDSIICDAKSGVSGAGRKASLALQYSEVSDSFRAYNIARHRHLPEIIQTFSNVTDNEIKLVFVPHLVPMSRGILSTSYIKLLSSDVDIQKYYVDFYSKDYFVDIMPKYSYPDTKSVRGTNFCRVSIHPDKADTETVVIVSVIDNLVKGAAGQAIQNMNIMFCINELAGLTCAGQIP